MTDPRKGVSKAGFLAGLLAAVAMVLFMVALRLTVGSTSLVEALADWFTEITPPRLFDILLTTLQTKAKPLLYVGLIGGMVLMGGFAGTLYGVLSYRIGLGQHQPLLRGLVGGLGLALGAFLFTGLVITPLIGAGLFGTSFSGGIGGFTATTLLSYAVYGVSLTGLMHQMRPVQRRERDTGLVDTSRRTFLKRMAMAAAALAGGGFIIRTLIQSGGSIGGSTFKRRAGQMQPIITPNEDFYVVSKNIIDPRVNEEKWALEVKGLVENPYTLSYQELSQLHAVEEFVTFICISNNVGGGLISNALWRGVRLKELLERAKMKPEVKKIAFSAEDGYSESIPPEIAAREEVLVAYEMNGEPLSAKHGFPARLVIPGLYGLKSVKWLNSIEAVADPDFLGYWQKRGWSDEAVIKSMSRIDVPRYGAGATVGEPAVLGGVAFAGLRGIRKVEISTDRGTNWEETEIIEEPLSPFTWVLWSGSFTPSIAHRFSVRVRATDGTGEVQTAWMTDPLPDGASGHHQIVVVARARKL